jgi:hypothetical protein
MYVFITVRTQQYPIFLTESSYNCIKFMAIQAHSIYQYNSLKTKFLKCSADIFFM